MGRFLFLGMAAFLAFRYIASSNRKQKELLEKQQTPLPEQPSGSLSELPSPAASGPTPAQKEP